MVSNHYDEQNTKVLIESSNTQKEKATTAWWCAETACSIRFHDIGYSRTHACTLTGVRLCECQLNCKCKDF